MPLINHSLEKSGFVPVNGGAIHYRLYEPNDQEKLPNTPIIVIHGGPGASHALLYNYLGALADNRPVVFYDQLGSFFSPAEMREDLMRVERFSEEVRLLTQELGYTKNILLGHSWGGAIATDYALKYQSDLEALILSCPLLSTARWETDCKALIDQLPPDISKTLSENSISADGDKYKQAEKAFMDKHFCRSTQTSQALSKHRAKFNHNIYRHMWGNSEFRCTGLLKNVDFFPDLQKIYIPTQILCGEFDMASPQTMQSAKDLMPNAKLAVIPNSGHLAFMDGNEVYLSSINNFLKSIWPSSPV